jgi:DNA-binding CsgD family transcriptional regulator
MNAGNFGLGEDRMGHLFLFAYIVLVLIGVVSIAISSFVYSRTRDTLLFHYIAYMTSFSLFIFTYFCVLGYIALNVASINFYFLLSIVFVGLVSSCLLMYTLPRFTHSLVWDSPSWRRRLSFALAALCACVLMLVSSRVSFAEEHLSQTRNVWLYSAICLFYAPIVYSIVLKGVSLRRLEGWRREVARNTMILDIIFFPGIVSDLYLFSRLQVFVSTPVLYCIVCVIYTRYITRRYLVQRASMASGFDEASVQTVLTGAGLSAREMDIVMHIAKGLGNKEIGEKLFISLNTVKTHNRNIFKKMGVKSRFQLLTKLSENDPSKPRI